MLLVTKYGANSLKILALTPKFPTGFLERLYQWFLDHLGGHPWGKTTTEKLFWFKVAAKESNEGSKQDIPGWEQLYSGGGIQ